MLRKINRNSMDHGNIIFVHTRSVSLDASLSTGIMNKKKKIDKIANPFAVRVCGKLQSVRGHPCKHSKPGQYDLPQPRGPKQR